MEGYVFLLTLLSLCQFLIALCPAQTSSISATTESSMSVRSSVPSMLPTAIVSSKSPIPSRLPTQPQVPDPSLLWPWTWYDYNWYKNSPYTKYNAGNMEMAGSHVQLPPGYPEGSMLRENYPMPAMTRPKFDGNTKFYDNNGYPMMQRSPMSNYPRPYEYLMDSTLLDVSSNNANSNTNVNLNTNMEKIRRRSRKGSAS